MSGPGELASIGPVLGTGGNDVLSVDKSVSFAWVPDPGASFSEGVLYFDVQDFEFKIATTTQPSTATGTVTLDYPSSQPFTQARASDFSFTFTIDGDTDLNRTLGGAWTWDPRTGVLDPTGTGAGWDDAITINLYPNSVRLDAYHGIDGFSAKELGHWAMVSNPIDTSVFGGAGNDTIYGGQGQETLSGDAGDDVIYVGRGEDVAFGGTGNDAIHGGLGTQFLDGGDGNDTIWGGTGTQTIMGDGGNDLIWGGDGSETISGGAGRDTIWGGSGTATLDGGAGADMLHAGTGNETLVGGAGRDVFAFGSGAAGHDVIADLQLGQDVVQVAAGFAGLAIARPHDLVAHVTAGPGGSALLDVGGLTVTLLGVSAAQVTGHLQQVFKVG